MADQEIAKHTKKVFKVFAQKHDTAWHKVRELALEIAIIVFAVSISIWLHGVSEHRHEQQQVKAFLLGLKIDLQTDITVMNKNIDAFRESDAKYGYLASLDPASPPDNEKFDAAYASIDDPLFGFIAHNGRYESFKSSGKLTNIENEALLERIAERYEFGLIAVRYGEVYWTANLERLKNFVENSANTGTREARYKLITSQKGKHLCAAMSSGPINDYLGMVDRDKRIIKDIDLAYPEEAATAR
jgi:hypothetical protein